MVDKVGKLLFIKVQSKMVQHSSAENRQFSGVYYSKSAPCHITKLCQCTYKSFNNSVAVSVCPLFFAFNVNIGLFEGRFCLHWQRFGEGKALSLNNHRQGKNHVSCVTRSKYFSPDISRAKGVWHLKVIRFANIYFRALSDRECKE